MAYLPGGAQQFGPGDALIQRYGMGAYTPTQNYFLTPAAAEGIRGMGCACGCGGECGMGLFDGGLDPSTWGAAEWGIVVIGAYAAYSMLFTTKAAARATRRKATGVRKGIKRGLAA